MGFVEISKLDMKKFSSLANKQNRSINLHIYKFKYDYLIGPVYNAIRIQDHFSRIYVEFCYGNFICKRKKKKLDAFEKIWSCP